MPTNEQIIPEGLLGSKETPYNVSYWNDDINYNVLNSDQIIIMAGSGDVLFDVDLIESGKYFIIKNTSGFTINIDPGTATVEGAASLGLGDSSIVHLIFCKLETEDIFYIVSLYTPA